jgi:hypothetical protein
MQVGSVSDHAVEVKKDGIELVSGYGDPHGSPRLDYLVFGRRSTIEEYASDRRLSCMVAIRG